MNDGFWQMLDDLVERCEFVIDRPKGTPHPRFPEVIYPLDYGYLKGTVAGDGDGLDAWRGSLAKLRLDAIVCTIDSVKRDAEIKLLLGCSPEDKDIVLSFLNKGSMAAILVGRRES